MGPLPRLKSPPARAYVLAASPQHTWASVAKNVAAHLHTPPDPWPPTVKLPLGRVAGCAIVAADLLDVAADHHVSLTAAAAQGDFGPGLVAAALHVVLQVLRAAQQLHNWAERGPEERGRVGRATPTWHAPSLLVLPFFQLTRFPSPTFPNISRPREAARRPLTLGEPPRPMHSAHTREDLPVPVGGDRGAWISSLHAFASERLQQVCSAASRCTQASWPWPASPLGVAYAAHHWAPAQG